MSVQAGSRLTAALLAPGPWTLITLTNGWIAGSTGNQKMSCRYHPLVNEIEIGGTINGASKTSNTFGVLPAGFAHPGAQVAFGVGQSGGSATVAPFLQCDTSGNLSIGNATTAVYIIGGRIFLDIPAI